MLLTRSIYGSRGKFAFVSLEGHGDAPPPADPNARLQPNQNGPARFWRPPVPGGAAKAIYANSNVAAAAPRVAGELLFCLFVVVVMFSIGLRVSGGELLDILRKRSLFVRTLLANCVLIPAIGFLLVRIFPLTPDASVGILLLAAIPGTPIALQFTRQAKTRLAFAAAMIFVLSLVSVAMTLSMANCYFAKPHGMQHCYIPSLCY